MDGYPEEGRMVLHELVYKGQSFRYREDPILNQLFADMPELEKAMAERIGERLSAEVSCFFSIGKAKLSAVLCLLGFSGFQEFADLVASL